MESEKQSYNCVTSRYQRPEEVSKDVHFQIGTITHVEVTVQSNRVSRLSETMACIQLIVQ